MSSLIGSTQVGVYLPGWPLSDLQGFAICWRAAVLRLRVAHPSTLRLHASCAIFHSFHQYYPVCLPECYAGVEFSAAMCFGLRRPRSESLRRLLLLRMARLVAQADADAADYMKYHSSKNGMPVMRAVDVEKCALPM
jgi:hypothetical protein